MENPAYQFGQYKPGQRVQVIGDQMAVILEATSNPITGAQSLRLLCDDGELKTVGCYAVE